MPSPRLKGMTKQLLLEHLCPDPNSTALLEQQLQSLSLNGSFLGPIRVDEREFLSPLNIFTKFMLTSKSSLIATRSSLRHSIVKLHHTKCYLKALRLKELVLDSNTCVAILRFTQPQQFELQIESDQVSLMQFAEFEDHIGGCTKFSFDIPTMSSNNKFVHMIRKLRPQLHELKCTINALQYMSMAHPPIPNMELDTLTVNFVQSADLINLPLIFKHSFKKLQLLEFNNQGFRDRIDLDDPTDYQTTMEHLCLQTSSIVNGTDELFVFVEDLKEQMPLFKRVEIEATEMFKHRNIENNFIDWMSELYNNCLLRFCHSNRDSFERIVLRIKVIKIWRDDEEPSEWIEALKQTDEYKDAQFYENTSIGDDFGHLSLVEGRARISIQMLTMSPLSGSFIQIF